MSRAFEGVVKGIERDERKLVVWLEEESRGFWIPVEHQSAVRDLKAGDRVCIKANPGRWYWFLTDIAIKPAFEEPKPTQELPTSTTTSVPDREGAGPEAAAQPTPKEAFAEIPLDRIIGGLGGFVPRSVDLAETGIDSLAGTMKKPGILQPIVVRRHRKEGYYELVCGERRVRAAERAGLSQIPAVIRDLSDRETFEAAFIENKHRKDLHDVEFGRMLKEMLKRFPQDYPTQEALSKAVGLSPQEVTQYIRAYDMAEELKRQPELSRDNIKPESLTEYQLRVLHQAKPEARAQILSQLTEELGKVPPAETIKQAIEEQPELRREERGRGRKPIVPIDTGVEFECPICHTTWIIRHYSEKKHTFEPIHEVRK